MDFNKIKSVFLSPINSFFPLLIRVFYLVAMGGD